MSDAALARALGGSIAQASGKAFEVTSIEPVSGGYIHAAFAISGKGAFAERYFAKVNEPDRAPIERGIFFSCVRDLLILVPDLKFTIG